MKLFYISGMLFVLGLKLTFTVTVNSSVCGGFMGPSQSQALRLLCLASGFGKLAVLPVSSLECGRRLQSELMRRG